MHSSKIKYLFSRVFLWRNILFQVQSKNKSILKARENIEKNNVRKQIKKHITEYMFLLNIIFFIKNKNNFI